MKLCRKMMRLASAPFIYSAENFPIMRYVIDTNVWVYAAMHKADIFSQLGGEEIFTLSTVIGELKTLSKGKGRVSSAAKVALRMMEKFGVKIIKHAGRSDEKLMELSGKGYVVVTNDGELIERIKNAGGKVMTLRKGRIVEEV